MSDNDFEKAAQQESQVSLARELWEFFRDNAAWWLAPIVALLLVLGAIAVLSGTAAAPFIYTLF
ncbi:MAG TPA: DUF5989 family protein [Pirellulales bacterium]|nr:DUF5989 family protein [Pirellulales bacterium]